jgi:hypothetical protein
MDQTGIDVFKVVHSDKTESRYFTKQQDYPFFVTIFRKYLRLLVPVLFASCCIAFALPFLSEGPIYLVALKEHFLVPCEGTWFLSFTFLQNMMHWRDTYDCNTCKPYILDDIEGRCQPPRGEGAQDTACKDSCGAYLSLFANIFQFFLLSVLIMIIHKYNRKGSYILIMILIGVFSVVNFTLVK